jgi:hypothetical protein
VEVDNGNGWTIVDTLTGAIQDWELRSINLSAFLVEDYLSLRFHTKINTSAGINTLGWYLDDIILRTEYPVEVETRQPNLMGGGFHEFAVSPNPGNNEFKISYYLPSEGNIEISLFNIRGQKFTIMERGWSNSEYQSLNWQADLPSGIYFLKLTFEDESIIQKLVILK